MLFFIGNGFDIAMGLKTSYSDFLDWYLSSEVKSNDSNVIKLKNAIKRDRDAGINSWADLEKKLGGYTGEYEENDKAAEDFICAYLDIKEQLDRYIGEIVKSAENEAHVGDVSKEVRKFIVDIAKYFEPTQHESEKLKHYWALKSSIEPTNRDVEYNFVTFNYTKTLEKCIDNKNRILRSRPADNGGRVNDSIGKIIHVHGINKIVDGSNKTKANYTLFGIDNEEQIINKHFQKHRGVRAHLIKPEINKELEKGVEESVKEVLSKSDVICFLGVSFGDSDVSWWRMVGDWLKAQQTRKVVIFKYSEKMKEAADEIIHKKDAEQTFRNQSGISVEEYEKIKHKVYINVDRSIFEHKLVK